MKKRKKSPKTTLESSYYKSKTSKKFRQPTDYSEKNKILNTRDLNLAPNKNELICNEIIFVRSHEKKNAFLCLLQNFCPIGLE